MGNPAERIERGSAVGIEQVRAARSSALDTLGAWALESSDVVLVVGEPAANAVRHAKTAFVLLSFAGSTLTVEVTDDSPALATMARTSGDDTSGRGPMIVVTSPRHGEAVRPGTPRPCAR